MAGLRNARIRAQEVGVPSSARHIGGGIVVGDVHVVPAIVQLHQIPHVVHLITGDGDAWDAQLTEQQPIGQGVALAHSVTVHQGAIGGENHGISRRLGRRLLLF